MSTDEPDTKPKPRARREPDPAPADTSDADSMSELAEATERGYLGDKVDPEPDESYQAGGKLGS